MAQAKAKADTKDGGAAEKKPAKQEQKVTASKKPTAVLMVRSTRKGGHRRAGMRWTREPIGIEVEALTKAQRQQLESDPSLVVEEAEVDL